MVDPSVSSTVESEISAIASNDDKQRMLCTVCNWVYDPEIGEPNQGVEPNTAWIDVPDYFLCPECNLGKDVFVEVK